MENQRKIGLSSIVLTAFGLIGLCISYVFQYSDFLFIITSHRWAPEWHFAFNRICRILLNDLSMLAVIYAIFKDRMVLTLAIFVQSVDLLILLPLYLLLKLPNEGVSELSSPFLSQFHRLIVNPTLMILLIPAVYYQKYLKIPSSR